MNERFEVCDIGVIGVTTVEHGELSTAMELAAVDMNASGLE